ncbi:MAG: S9 family peptidase [Deltaproteobacteria bacterium]|nr:S9 family peptidase [Deltaproteobacteria bacterium]
MSYPISEFFKRIRVFGASLSDDGRQLCFVSSVSGSPQLWIADVPPQGLIHYPRPLTDDEHKRPYIWEPGLKWIGVDKIAVMFDTDGDEASFIEILDLKSGDIVSVPRVVGSRDILSHVSDDRKFLFFSSNRVHKESQSLFQYSLKNGKVEEIYSRKGINLYWAGKTHKNEHYFYEIESNVSNRLYSINLKSKKVQPIFVEKDCAVGIVSYHNKNKFLVVTDFKREFQNPAVLDVSTNKLDFLFPDKWDRSTKLFNKKLLFIEENRAGQSVLSIYQWRGHREALKFRWRSKLNKGVISHISFTKNSTYALISYHSSIEPLTYYRMNLKNFKIQLLMNNYVSKIPQKKLVSPKIVTYKSQGRDVYSLLFLPKSCSGSGIIPAKAGTRTTKKCPVIVWPHGGPQSQERPQPRPIFQYFINKGFAIWAPNHAGSTGFGRTFTKAIMRNWGTADLPDMKNGIEWLKKSRLIDPQRIFIVGGSYGGYMTLRCLTQLNGQFKAGAELFGPSNLLTFATTVPADWMPYMDAFLGNPEKDKDMLVEQSPVFALDKIDCPLLVVQGAKDPRVVKAESDQVVEKLRQLRGERAVEYLVFEDEGHGFFKRDNELKCYERVAQFLERYL